MSAWAGALPHPDFLRQFGEIIPDGAERIMRLAEREQEHRISLEKAALPENLSAMRRGQYLGFSISAIALILAAITSYFGGHPAVSIALVGVPVFAVAKTLVEKFAPRGDQ